eukprot:1160290-Pelagomonas_calceolata.AAC.2
MHLQQPDIVQPHSQQPVLTLISIQIFIRFNFSQVVDAADEAALRIRLGQKEFFAKELSAAFWCVSSRQSVPLEKKGSSLVILPQEPSNLPAQQKEKATQAVKHSLPQSRKRRHSAPKSREPPPPTPSSRTAAVADHTLCCGNCTAACTCASAASRHRPQAKPMRLIHCALHHHHHHHHHPQC